MKKLAGWLSFGEKTAAAERASFLVRATVVKSDLRLTRLYTSYIGLNWVGSIKHWVRLGLYEVYIGV